LLCVNKRALRALPDIIYLFPIVMKYILCTSLRFGVLFSLILFLAHTGFALDVYISKTGKDTNPGTMEKPLATFEAAQKKIRSIRQPVVVYVRGGTYYFKKPMVFLPEDSRRAEEKVVYQSYENEKVVISGAVPIKLQWKPYKKNIFKAFVPDPIIFDQLFVNGEKQRMSRYPNYDPSSSHFGGYSEDVLAPEKIKSWQNPAGAFIHALHKHEWGGYHYRVTGKNVNGQLEMEGGFQNNRQMGMHDRYRFIEHVFEELDTTGEWYLNKKERTLYLYATDLKMLQNAQILTPQLKSLFEFRGSETSPVRNISLEGFVFEHVLRTFMDTKEPLLRSDWAIYRGGTVVLEGTEHCQIRNCHFKEVGGNGVFYSNYNRKSDVIGCHFENIGASGVCLVGNPDAVRSPSFEYQQAIPYAELDQTAGPKTNNYPADCQVHDNLMHGLGQVEKQVAGVEISMAMGITVRHNTIYNVPRSGINVSEGTWGGHLIEFNDVFNTVLETGDHGAFNSWGRDRFWHPDRQTMDKLTSEHPKLILLDAQRTVTIRNNRFRCDHGWDIDLDDGSSNYHIYNNLCLNGGLKLREGFHRVVENNILVNNSFHPHVWFKQSEDVFRKNIVLKPYYPIQITEWGKEVDFNLFPDVKAWDAAKANGTDAHSMAGDPLFKDPLKGDYTVMAGSPALQLGFVNFPMDAFGVVSPALKSKAERVPLPVVMTASAQVAITEITWLGATLRNVSGLGDRSAYGLPDEQGVVVESIPAGSILAKSPLQKGDVIRKMNGKDVVHCAELTRIFQEINWIGHTNVEIMRNQQKMALGVHFK
jgi:hypothetical protein